MRRARWPAPDRSRGAGVDIVVSSVAGLRGRRSGDYGITEGGRHFDDADAGGGVGPSEIRVNAIAPGLVDTRLASALTQNKDIVDTWWIGRPSVGMRYRTNSRGSALFSVRRGIVCDGSYDGGGRRHDRLADVTKGVLEMESLQDKYAPLIAASDAAPANERVCDQELRGAGTRSWRTSARGASRGVPAMLNGGDHRRAARLPFAIGPRRSPMKRRGWKNRRAR